MAVNLDWGLAQQNPNVVGNYLQGQQQGNALREQAANAQMRQLQMNALQRQMQGQQEAGAALKTGDTTGAQNALIGTGQYEGASAIGKLTDEQAARARQASDDLLTATSTLRSLPPEQRMAAAQQMLPQLQARNPNIRPEMLQSMDLSDTGLDSAERQLIGVKGWLDLNKPVSVEPGASLINPHTGGTVASVAPKPVAVEPGGSLVNPTTGQSLYTSPNKPMVVPYGSTLFGDQGAAGAGGAPAGDSRGVRNNNPLNLTTLQNGAWAGQTGTDGKFAVFANPQDGMAAADKNLQAKQTLHGLNTLNGIIGDPKYGWAPASDHNDPVAYAKTVAQAVGVTPDQPLDLRNPAMRQKILAAMSQVELGGTPSPGGARAGGWAPIATNGPQMGTADPNVTGPAALKGVAPAMANQVKAIAEGRMQVPSGMVLRTPYGQQLMQLVSQYDPSFDAVNYNARNRTRQQFTSGGPAQSINAARTAIGHMGKLMVDIDQLPNVGILPGQINPLIRMATNATGSDVYTNFSQAKTAVASELRKIYTQSGGSLEELRQWEDSFNAANSPQQLKGALKQGVDLLDSKLNALVQQYQDGMGTKTDAATLLKFTPAMQRTYARLHGDDPGSQAKPAGQPSLQRLSPQQATSLKPGTHFLGEDGVERVRQ